MEGMKLVSDPCELVSTLKAGTAIAVSKLGKSTGPSVVVVEMLKASMKAGRQWLT